MMDICIHLVANNTYLSFFRINHQILTYAIVVYLSGALKWSRLFPEYNCNSRFLVLHVNPGTKRYNSIFHCCSSFSNTNFICRLPHLALKFSLTA